MPMLADEIVLGESVELRDPVGHVVKRVGVNRAQVLDLGLD